MSKIIAGINMTLDGFCDHTAVSPDEEIHDHYSELLRNADAIWWGRKTYQLMENAWPQMVEHHTGNKAMDDFAQVVDNIPKIVFSRTLKSVDWKNTTLKNEINREEILRLKRQVTRPILAGSPSLIVTFAKMNLVDEFQLMVHPVVVGSGLVLFKNITERIELKLLKTKTFASGAVLLCYAPAGN